MSCFFHGYGYRPLNRLAVLCPVTLLEVLIYPLRKLRILILSTRVFRQEADQTWTALPYFGPRLPRPLTLRDDTPRCLSGDLRVHAHLLRCLAYFVPFVRLCCRTLAEGHQSALDI